MIKEKLTAMRVLLAGESYWSCRMSSGKTWSELDEKTVEVPTLQGVKQYRTRRLEWLEDIIGSGDIKNVKEVYLHTPKGTARTHVGEAYTAFQFSRGTSALLTGQRLKNLQVIGAVFDKDTGECTSAIWDYQAQRLFVDTLWDKENKKEYQGHNSIRDFKAWRDGVIPIGPLNVIAMDTRIA
jgi:hypothetical protein